MLNLLFPRVCLGCEAIISSTEEVLCASCRHLLPLTNFHRNGIETVKNKVYGRFPVENGASLLYFQRKGLSQQLIHQLKYRGAKEVSSFFGKWLGAELQEIEDYATIDMVIPVPLHKNKLKKRGYNQVEGFGREIAGALEIPYRDEILIKISKTGSQVLKNRILRFEAIEVFAIQNLETINNQHILLVDDIITTGATLEKCAIQLLKANNVKISIATMAMT